MSYTDSKSVDIASFQDVGNITTSFRRLAQLVRAPR